MVEERRAKAPPRPQTSPPRKEVTLIDLLLAAAPKFDEVTEISLNWCRQAMDEISDDIEVLDFYDREAVKNYVLQALNDKRPQWFVHYDHGSEYVMWGDDEEPIIDLSNLDRLAGMHVYCMNCSSGKGLGAHAVEKGIIEYWGYIDVVSFTTDAIEEFGLAFNYGIVKALKEGKWLKDVVEDARQNGYDTADKLRDDGKIMAAASLVRDMNILHVYYEGGPEPPEPECWFSRLAKRLFGWNGLWLLRMLRQKILGPERVRKF